MNLDAVPEELKTRRQWVVCGDDKILRKPMDPARKAKVNDPTTWSGYGEAVAALEAPGSSFLGYVFLADDPVAGVDFDDCRNPDSGVIDAAVQAEVEKLDSYTEVSPSGTGLHVLVTLDEKLPAHGRKKSWVEIYESGRFFTITGSHLPGTPATINARTQEVLALHKRAFGDKDATLSTDNSAKGSNAKSGALTDVPKMTDRQRIRLLEDGKWGEAGFPSQSEADLAFVRHLIVKLGGDLVKVDEMFRASGLMRDKWDERHSADGKTYGEMTIQSAVESLAQDLKRMRRKVSQADELLELAEPLHLVRVRTGEGFAVGEEDGIRQTISLESQDFKHYLLRKYYLSSGGRAPSETALKAAIDTLKAKARFEGEEVEVHLRIGGGPDVVYLDLGRAKWEAVEVTGSGWQIVPQPPVLFARSAGMLPLPYPEAGGSLDLLRPLLNMETDEHWILYVAWLMGCLNPSGPYPILILQGEQGSAKSMAARIAKAVLDPEESPLRPPPTSDRDLLIAASHTRILAYDNLSGIDRDMGDSICRLATGGGNRLRKLYTDNDEVIFNAVRPITVNGIEDLTAREDLASRAIVLHLPSIPAGRRKEESRLWEEFDRVHARVLGALLDAVAAALASRRKAPRELPRMADFARWVIRSEESLPWEPGRFMAAYARSIDDVAEDTLANDPVASILIEMLQTRGIIQETASTLLEMINNSVSFDYQRPLGWPKSPRMLSNRLDRLAPHFRAVGIAFERGKSGNRYIRLEVERTQGTQDSGTSNKDKRKRATLLIR